MDVAITLTRAELEAPFKAAAIEPEAISGPTRTALEIVEDDRGFEFTDIDPVTDEVIETTTLLKGQH